MSSPSNRAIALLAMFSEPLKQVALGLTAGMMLLAKLYVVMLWIKLLIRTVQELHTSPQGHLTHGLALSLVGLFAVAGDVIVLPMLLSWGVYGALFVSNLMRPHPGQSVPQILGLSTPLAGWSALTETIPGYILSFSIRLIFLPIILIVGIPLYVLETHSFPPRSLLLTTVRAILYPPRLYPDSEWISNNSSPSRLARPFNKKTLPSYDELVEQGLLDTPAPGYDAPYRKPTAPQHNDRLPSYNEIINDQTTSITHPNEDTVREENSK